MRCSLTIGLAKFLFNLGLRRFPPLPELLKISAGEVENLASIALKYFMDNSSKYYPDYDPHSFKNAKFVPAMTFDGKMTKGSPTEVFIHPDASVLEFLVVHPSVREVATDKLKLRQHPPISLILPLLESRAPQDVPTARRWFEALAGRLMGKQRSFRESK